MEQESLLVRCACGWEASGTEDAVVAATREHGRRLHNMEATREQVLAMAVRANVVDDRGLNPEPGRTPPR